MGVVTIDVSSIGLKFDNFMQAGCRDQGLHRGRTMYCQKPIILLKLHYQEYIGGLVLLSTRVSHIPALEVLQPLQY